MAAHKTLESQSDSIHSHNEEETQRVVIFSSSSKTNNHRGPAENGVVGTVLYLVHVLNLIVTVTVFYSYLPNLPTPLFILERLNSFLFDHSYCMVVVGTVIDIEYLTIL